MTKLYFMAQETCSEGHMSIDKASVERMAGTFFMRAGRPDNDRLFMEDFINVMKKKPDLVYSFREKDSTEPSDQPNSKKAVSAVKNFLKASYAKTCRILRVSRFCLPLQLN